MDESQQAIIDTKIAGFLERQGPQYQRCRFEDYAIDSIEQSDAVNLCQKYANEFPKYCSESKLSGLVLFGPSRTGKGHLARSICMRITERFGHLQSRKFSSLVCSVRNCRLLFEDNRKEGFDSEKLSTLAFLVLEDPFAGSTRMTDAQADLIYRILERRFTNGLPTCVTTNFTRYKDFENAFQSRNLNRLGLKVLKIHCNWEPYRG